MKLRRTSIALKFIFLIFVLVGSTYAESTNISSEEFRSNDQLVDKNPFTSGSPELKNCLHQALGEESFNSIALERRPTKEEDNLMEPCMAKYSGQRDNSKDSRNQNDQNPFTPSLPDLTGVIERCSQRPVIPAHGYQGLLTDVHVHTSPSSDST